MIVWSTTSPQIKHRQLKEGPFGPKSSSWIIIPLHRLHFTLSSKKLSLWDHGVGIRQTPYFTVKDIISQGEVAGETSLFTQSRYEGGMEANQIDYISFWKQLLSCFLPHIHFCYNLLSFLGPSDVFKNHWEPWGRSCRVSLGGKGRKALSLFFVGPHTWFQPATLSFQDCLKTNIRCYLHRA